MGDRFAAIRGVMACIVSKVVLREMPPVLPFDLEQVRVSLADDDDSSGRWEETAHVSSDPPNHPQVIDRSAQTRDHSLDLVLPRGELISNLEHRGLAILLARSHLGELGREPPDLPGELGNSRFETAACLVDIPGPIASAFPSREPFRQSGSQ